MPKVLIIHNILWSHYKNALFKELLSQAKQESDLEIKVVQIAKNEMSRRKMESNVFPDYSCTLLFNDYVENINPFQVLVALFREIRRFRPDVINVTGFYSLALLFVIFLAPYLFRAKIVISNDSTLADNPRTKWWKQRIKKLAIRSADGFFCYGRKAAQYMLSLGAQEKQIFSQRMAVVDNDLIEKIYLEALPQRKRYGFSHAFIFVGRFSEEKNLSLLLDSFERLKSKHWGLILLGEGNLKAGLQEQITTRSLSDRVMLIDGKAWYEIPKYLASANVLVLPSRTEPWGLVANEAMACGIPVIASNKCGCADDLVIHDHNGMVFDASDPNGLEEAMRRFVVGECTCHFSENARLAVEGFSIQNAARDMINSFKTMLRQSVRI